MFEEFVHLSKKRKESFKDPAKNPFSTMTQGSRHELFERWYKMSKDPIEFFKAVRTLDESAQTNPIRPFPWRLKYIQFLVAVFRSQRLVAIPKSRRMKVSWTVQAYSTWDGMFNIGRHQAMVSKKEQDSDELLERCAFILKNLDPEIFPKELIPQWEKTYCFLHFPDLISKMRGIAQGEDQARQYTYSRLNFDEFAFWQKAEDTFAAAKPTLEGSDGNPGGQAIIFSSRAPGFFKRLCYDKIDQAADFLYENTQEELQIQSPLEGVDCWTNRNNKFFVVDLHYTADPAKRSAEWHDRESAGISKAKWNREYEKSWDTYEGLPVFSDFNEVRHTTRNPPPPLVGVPMLRGWDCTGMTQAAVVGQLQEDQLVLYKEFEVFNGGTKKLGEKVIPACNQLWPGVRWIDFIDPAGETRDSSDEGQSALVLDSMGLQCITGAITYGPRLEAVEYFLLGWSPKKDTPNLLIDIRHCPVLVRGFKGGYRYSDKVLDLEPNKIRPLKDEHSHYHDSLQYLASGLFKIIPRLRKSRGRAAGSSRKQLSYSSSSGGDQKNTNKFITNPNTDFGRILKPKGFMMGRKD